MIYLITQSVAQITLAQMMEWLMNNEVGVMAQLEAQS
jgi:hypothetical protein